MAAQILDGKVLSAQILDNVRNNVNALKAETGRVPGLAVILVGEDPASQIYVRNKGLACETTGIHSLTLKLPGNITQAELETQIDALNADDTIDGILIQLPLPSQLDEASALARILPEKDVDGFHLVNAGKLMTGATGVIPCTPGGALYMLRSAGLNLTGKHAVVIGRSNIVGKPMAMLLLQQNCTVTICHSRTQNLKDEVLRGDIVVAAVGKPHFITADMIREGAVVIDVGINRMDGKVVGDVDFETVKQKASWITPVPGGVGKMTVAMLMQNTVDAAKLRGAKCLGE